ncbi:hypothetical protein OROHE_020597 [Orobanche hederae]
MLGDTNIAFESARSHFWVVDANIGLGTLLCGSKIVSRWDATGSSRMEVAATRNGHIGHCNQANNMLLFPGIGLGTLLSGSKIISDGMLQAAAEWPTEEEVQKGIIYPSISSIRDITKEVAAAVITEAIEEDLVEGYREMDAWELHKLNRDEIRTHITNNMWNPDYTKLVYKKD